MAVHPSLAAISADETTSFLLYTNCCVIMEKYFCKESLVLVKVNWQKPMPRLIAKNTQISYISPIPVI